MKHLEKLTRKRLGEILVDEGLISKSQLVDAERECRESAESLGPVLVAANFISDWDLAKIVASQYQLPFVDLGTVGISNEVEGMFPVEEQRKHRFVPIDRIGQLLTLAVAEMPDIEFLRRIREKTGLTPFLFVALLSDLRKQLTDESELLAEAAGPVAEKTPELKVTKPAPTADEDWQKGLSIFDEAEPEARAEPTEKAEDSFFGSEPSEAEWENIFDSANESVLKEIDRE